MPKDILDAVLRQRVGDIAKEPRVPLTFRVGGTGHRSIDHENVEQLSQTLTLILSTLRQVASKVGEQSTEAHAGADVDLFVLTPLAEGADRIVARVGVANGFRLGAVLPFEPRVYETTFDLSPNTREAVQEFRELLDAAALPNGYGVLALDGDATPHSRVKAYRDCAAVLADWSDLLIAVLQGDRWGSESGISTRDAIDRGTLVIVIDPREPERFRLATAGELLEPEDSTVQRFETLVREAMAPRFGDEKESSEGLQDYLAERIRARTPSVTDYEGSSPFSVSTVAPIWVSPFRWLNRAIIDLPQRLFVWRYKRRLPEAARSHAWDMPFDPVTARPFVDLFLRQQRADAAASAYAALHRSGQILVVFFSLAIALMAAFAANKTNPYLTAFELLLLAYVLSVVVVAQRQRWLERWLDYRLIAEVLRCAKFQLVSGRCALSSGVGPSFAIRTESRSWAYNYCRDVFRSMRLAMPGRAATIETQSRAAVTNYLVHQCIDAQVMYHSEASSLRHSVEKALQWMALAVLAASFALLAIKVVIDFRFGGIDLALMMRAPLVVDIAASLPAIASALLALRSYGEHMVVVRRSKTLLAALELHRRQITESTSIYSLQQRLGASLGAQLRDVEGWFDLFSNKALEA